MTEFITVYEKLKSLTLDEWASLLSQLCKNAETCAECPLDPARSNWDCPCTEKESAWKEWLQREIPK